VGQQQCMEGTVGANAGQPHQTDDAGESIDVPVQVLASLIIGI